MSETFTMALAILNCHGSRDSDLQNIQRKPKDVLTLDYMGLKFKVVSEHADIVARFIQEVFFYRKYQFNGGTEYDSLPIYKIVETISGEFRNRVNALIKPVPARQAFIEECVLGTEPCARSSHERFRAMRNELVSCKLLPYKKFEKKGKGIFGMMSVQDTRPAFHGKSFKIIQNLRNKNYYFSDQEGHYIKFMKLSVIVTTSGFVQFTVLDTNEQPYAFNEEGEVEVNRDQVITDLMETFPECNLVTLIDLTCNTCDDYNTDTERENFRIPRANLSDSEPGEGGGKRTRSKKRGRNKSIRRRNKSNKNKRTRRKSVKRLHRRK